MGNISSLMDDAKDYMGWTPVLTPDEAIDQTSNIHNNLLEQNVSLIHHTADLNADNLVTKDEMREYFNSLSEKIDKNNDGMISKDEVEEYVKEQLILSRDETDKWKKEYERMYNKYQELEEKLRMEDARVLEVSTISNKRLKEYIQSEILDTDNNNTWIPDPIEMRAYLTLYKTFLKSIEKLSEKTAFEILNHKISFAIQPVEPKPLETQDKKFFDSDLEYKQFN